MKSQNEPHKITEKHGSNKWKQHMKTTNENKQCKQQVKTKHENKTWKQQMKVTK